MKKALIILDRDGVLNKLLVRKDGSTDSPMTMDEIEIFNWVPNSLKDLNSNYYLSIATNQPAAAKGKISKSNLCDIHSEIIKRAGSSLLFIEEAICFHRSEDKCLCRKPNTGLLKQIFSTYQNIDKNYNYHRSWMVGDRATDIIAGYRFGLNTALLGPSVDGDLDILEKENIIPTYHGTDLRDFVKELKKI